MENKIFEMTSVVNKASLKPILEAEFASGKEKIAKILKADCVIIGRSADADIRINDQKLSKHHFMIINHTNRFYVKDLNSTNGIIVNGKKVRKTVLTGADKIVAGSTTFRFMLVNNEYSFTQTRTPKISLSTPLAYTFDNSYKKIERSKTRNAIIASVIAGLIVTSAAISMFSAEKEVRVAPVAQTKVIPTSRSIDLEIADALLNEQDRVRVLNHYSLAEHHFSLGNYELSKKSMESVFEYLPDSIIAPTFIASCEAEIARFAKAEDNLKEIEEEENKRAAINTLLKAAYAELDTDNYSGAISIFQQVLEIDLYNSTALEGITTAEKAMQQSLPIPPDSIPVVRPSKGNLYVMQMNNAYKGGDYTKAYEVAARILKMGQNRAGKKAFVSANRMQQHIVELTNNMFNHMVTEARLLAKTGSNKEAADIYRRVLALFAHHKTAKTEINIIHRKLHEEAKLLYAKALLEESYSNISEAKSKLELILKTAPANDTYYKKARNKLKQIEIQA